MSDLGNGLPIHRLVGTEDASTYWMGDGGTMEILEKWCEYFENNGFSPYSQNRIMKKG